MRIRVIIEDFQGKVLVEKSIEVTRDQIHAIAEYDPDTTVECSDVFISSCVIADYLIK